MAGTDDAISQLQNIARQIGEYARAITNTNPQPSSNTSPTTTGTLSGTIGATATTIIGASTSRHGLFFHNPGQTTVFIYPTGFTPAPSTTSLSGTICFYPGGSLSFPSSEFPNVNTGWSAFTIGGGGVFTVLEFS